MMEAALRIFSVRVENVKILNVSSHLISDKHVICKLQGAMTTDKARIGLAVINNNHLPVLLKEALISHVRTHLSVLILIIAILAAIPASLK